MILFSSISITEIEFAILEASVIKFAMLEASIGLERSSVERSWCDDPNPHF
jgi:hypothetical protein